jgi:hypothetical protein
VARITLEDEATARARWAQSDDPLRQVTSTTDRAGSGGTSPQQDQLSGSRPDKIIHDSKAMSGQLAEQLRFAV